MKREKAITLIELVITIAILIILFVVSILELQINGFFEKSRYTNEKIVNEIFEKDYMT